MTEDVTVACHVRAPMLLEPVDSHVETLRACESEDAIDSLLLRSWPDKVRLSEDGPHQEVIERFERFERWADRRGVSVRPPFERRTVTKAITDETRELLVTPLICLAVYRDEELVGVFPHSTEEDTYTVADAIATLRTGEVPTPLGSAPSPSTASASGSGETCPECGAALVNGQGLFSCSNCEWVGTATEDSRLVSVDEDARVRTPQPIGPAGRS